MLTILSTLMAAVLTVSAAPAAVPAATADPTFTNSIIEAHAHAILVWQQAERDEAIRIWNAEVERRHQAWHAEQDRLAAEAAAARAEVAARSEREAPVRRSQARQAPQAAVRASSPQRATQGSGACGGNLPSCAILACESGGKLTAENPTSSASGKWQFLDSSWNNYGGYARASDAPEHVQDAAAAALWDGGRGRSHWSC